MSFIQSIINDKTRYLRLCILAWGGGFIYLLPYIRYTFYDPLQKALGIDHTAFGVSMSAYGICALLTYWPGGWLADRISARKLLSFSYLATGLLGFYFTSYPSYIMTVVVHGAWGICTTLTFWAAFIRATKDMAGEAEQGKFFGLLEGIRGLVSTVASFAVVAIFAKFAVEQDGLTWSLHFISAGTVFAAVLTWFFFEDSKELEPSPSIAKDIIETLKSPWVWAVAIIVFSCYSAMAIGSYLTPYLTEIMGVSAASAAFWSTFWTYGCQFLAGPVGGILGDRIGSRPTVLFFGFVLLLMTATFIYMAPANASWAGIMIFMFIMLFAAMYAIRGVYFTLIEDLKIPAAISGAAIGFASVIGFAPDAFMYTWAGNILDTHKGIEGYKILFGASAGLSALGVVVSGIVAFYVMKKNKAVVKNEPSKA
ncbi:MAG: MFS transporter [Desulfobacterales bacterium]|nr:MFS transporter [Desulfobacterales bacterium]